MTDTAQVDPLVLQALKAKALLAQKLMGSQPQDQGETIATTRDGGKVMRAKDGSLSFTSPAYSTNDPQKIAEIMQGATGADVSMAGFDQQTIASHPAAAMASKAVQGVPFLGQWADEAAGAMFGPQSQSGMQALQGAMDRQRPGQSMALQLGGGLLGSAPIAAVAAPLAAAGRVLSPVMQVAAGVGAGALGGAVEGAVSGAGAANDGNRAKGAAEGAMFGGLAGGVMGGVMPVAAKGIKYAYQNWFAGTDVAAIASSLGVSKAAAKILKTYVSQDNPAEAARLLARAGDKAMLADAGPASSQLLDTAVAGGGAAMGIARTAVENRSAAAMQLLNGVMDKVLGPVEGVQALASGIASRTQSARKAAYEAAYNSAINYADDTGKAIEEVLSRIPADVKAAAIKEANDAMLANGVKNKQIMAEIAADGTVKFRQMPNVQQLDELKKALGSLADGMKDQFGRLTGPGIRASKLAGELKDAIAAAVPRYATAVKLGGDKIAEDRALALGTKLLSPSVTREEAMKAMAGASKEALLAARKGLRSAIDEGLAQVQAVLSDPNTEAREAIKLVKQLSSRANIEKVATILGDKSANDLMATLDTAGTQLALKTAISANSKTAVRQAGQQAMDSIINGGPLEALARGDVGAATKGIISMLTNRTPEALTAKTQAIYAEVAKVLTQIQGPTARAAYDVIQKALAKQPISEQEARLVSTVLTAALGSSGYQSTMQLLAPQGSGTPRP